MGTTTLVSRSWSSTLRRLVTATALPVAVVGLSACGANFDAQTSQIYQAAEGTNDRSALVYSLNTLVVGDGEGNGTVVARLVNNGPVEDALESYTAQQDDGTEIKVVALEEPIPIATAPSPDQSIQVGTDGLLRLTGDNFAPGDFVTLNFVFSESEPLSMEVPVVPVTPEYASIPVGPVPTPTDETDTPAEG